MDIYTKTNFRKNLYSILKKAAKTNQSVEILNGEQTPSGASDSMVLISKKDYNELQAARSERLAQSTKNIAKIAAMDAKHLTSEKEIEDWLNED